MAEEIPRKNVNHLEGLLKFCVENTAAEDTTTHSAAVEMDPERRKWLQEAISSFTSNDEITLMKRCLEILAKPIGTLSSDEEEDAMNRENALEHLESVVDNIDNAKDCYKLGGFQILLNYLDSPCSSLQWRAAAVLGLCFQNNTFCQDKALQLNILPKLLELVDSKTSDEQVNIKALFAVAGLIRGHAEAERNFVMQNGFSYLLRALQRNIAKLNVKTIFLLSNLIEGNKEYLENLYNMGVLEYLITILQTPHDPYHEHVLNILVKFVNNLPSALQDCRQEKYGLKQILNHHKQYLMEKDPEAYQEELDLCSKLIMLCFDENFTGSQEQTER